MFLFIYWYIYVFILLSIHLFIHHIERYIPYTHIYNYIYIYIYIPMWGQEAHLPMAWEVRTSLFRSPCDLGLSAWAKENHLQMSECSSKSNHTSWTSKSDHISWTSKSEHISWTSDMVSCRHSWSESVIRLIDHKRTERLPSGNQTWQWKPHYL